MSLIYFQKNNKQKLKEHAIDVHLSQLCTIIRLVKTYKKIINQVCPLPHVLLNIIIEYNDEEIELIVNSELVKKEDDQFCGHHQIRYNNVFNFIFEYGMFDYMDEPYYSIYCVQINNSIIEIIDAIEMDKYTEPRSKYHNPYNGEDCNIQEFDEINFDVFPNFNVFFDSYMENMYSVKNYIYPKDYTDVYYCKYINENKYIIYNKNDNKVSAIIIKNHKKLKNIIVLIKKLTTVLNEGAMILSGKI